MRPQGAVSFVKLANV